TEDTSKREKIEIEQHAWSRFYAVVNLYDDEEIEVEERRARQHVSRRHIQIPVNAIIDLTKIDEKPE
ncbi:13336_t:CDS:1, partial [Cetraspora pellucida]